MRLNLVLVLVLVLAILLCICIQRASCIKENYTDPIWMQPHKLYSDYYPRSNGSLYGTPREGWDIFNEIKYYPSAY